MDEVQQVRSGHEDSCSYATTKVTTSSSTVKLVQGYTTGFKDLVASIVSRLS